MAILTVTSLTTSGVQPSSYLTAAASGGDQFRNNGSTIFHVKNDGAGACAVTVDGNPDVLVSVPGNSERILGPYKVTDFNDSNGRVNVSYDQVSTVTVGAVEV
jgi:hypothetical protein